MNGTTQPEHTLICLPLAYFPEEFSGSRFSQDILKHMSTLIQLPNLSWLPAKVAATL